jgi:putative transposase
MPSKAKKVDRDVAKLPSIPKELVELFRTGPMTGEAINAAGIAFKTALIEASLNAELSHHLGYAPGSDKPDQVTNHRNGSTSKTVLTGDGKVRIETPRDREGSFEPLLLPKHARRFTAFDDSIVALYARGLTVREIQAHLIEIYGTEVSPQLVSTVTDGVLAEVTTWQSRPLEAVYAVQHSVGVCQAYPNARVVFFDALRVKMREDNVVRNKAVYLALGVRRDGTREILGLWIETTEGAKFWMKVFNDLRTCGVLDILIAVTDGLTGMPTALEVVFPQTTLHLAFRSAWLTSDRTRLACANRSRGTPTKRRADLHRALDPRQPRLRQLEGPQTAGRGAAPDLCRGQCGGRRGGAGRVRGWRVGAEVPHRGGGLAPGLGAGDPVLHLSARDQAGDLHHQRD